MKMYRVYNNYGEPCDTEIETKNYMVMCGTFFYEKQEANNYIKYLKELFNTEEDYFIKEINIKE